MDLILRHFPYITPVQIAQYRALEPLYQDWNQKINIISRKDIQNLYTNHVLHSMTITKYVKFSSDEVVLDAGTGGGFPGLPLAILCPDTQFVLVDSINKKLLVVQAIAKELGLANITVKHSRVEDVDGSFNYVVSRAVTRLDKMWFWVEKKLIFSPQNDIPNGLLYLKGGNISQEIPNNCIVQQIPLQELVDESIFFNKALVHIYKK